MGADGRPPLFTAMSAKEPARPKDVSHTHVATDHEKHSPRGRGGQGDVRSPPQPRPMSERGPHNPVQPRDDYRRVGWGTAQAP